MRAPRTATPALMTLPYPNALLTPALVELAAGGELAAELALVVEAAGAVVDAGRVVVDPPALV